MEKRALGAPDWAEPCSHRRGLRRGHPGGGPLLLSKAPSPGETVHLGTSNKEELEENIETV
jgi:hypothetical protein